MIETNPSLSPQPTTVIAPAIRATPTLSQAQRQSLAMRQARAVAVLVRRSAVEATKGERAKASAHPAEGDRCGS
jgi:hypothetical protein